MVIATNKVLFFCLSIPSSHLYSYSHHSYPISSPSPTFDPDMNHGGPSMIHDYHVAYPTSFLISTENIYLLRLRIRRRQIFAVDREDARLDLDKTKRKGTLLVEGRGYLPKPTSPWTEVHRRTMQAAERRNQLYRLCWMRKRPGALTAPTGEEDRHEAPVVLLATVGAATGALSSIVQENPPSSTALQRTRNFDERLKRERGRTVPTAHHWMSAALSTRMSHGLDL